MPWLIFLESGAAEPRLGKGVCGGQQVTMPASQYPADSDPFKSP
jgi:hypothetical protein